MSWVRGNVNKAIDAVRSELAPITDTLYAANELVNWVVSIVSSLPGEFRGILQGTIDRLRSAIEPRPGTVSHAARKLIEENPDSELAQKVRAIEKAAVAAELSAAKARVARQVSENAATATASDPSPEVNVRIASAAAQELAARAQQTPSTRAAVQLLIEAFAAFMDQQARRDSDVSSRVTAIVQQQAVLSEQLATLAEQSSTLVQLVAEQQKREAESAAVAAATAASSVMGGFTAVGKVLEKSADDTRRERLYRALTELYRR